MTLFMMFKDWKQKEGDRLDETAKLQEKLTDATEPGKMEIRLEPRPSIKEDIAKLYKIVDEVIDGSFWNYEKEESAFQGN